jgi:hypothetical protein
VVLWTGSYGCLTSIEIDFYLRRPRGELGYHNCVDAPAYTIACSEGGQAHYCPVYSDRGLFEQCLGDKNRNSRNSKILDYRVTDGTEVVSLTRRPLSSPQEDS